MLKLVFGHTKMVAPPSEIQQYNFPKIELKFCEKGKKTKNKKKLTNGSVGDSESVNYLKGLKYL